MKRYCVHAAAIVVLSAGVQAQSAGDNRAAQQGLLRSIERLVTTHSANPDDLLKQLDKACVDAMVQSNIDALSMIEADEFTFVTPDGAIMNKEQDLATLRSGDLKYESVELQDVAVRVFGDTGVVTGRANVKGRIKTYDISGSYRYTVTFVRRAARWQAVASQMTRIQGGPPTTAGGK